MCASESNIFSNYISAECRTSLFAFSSPCCKDEYHRPSVGYINFCTRVSTISVWPAIFRSTVLIQTLVCPLFQNIVRNSDAGTVFFNLILHELSHALGFSQSTFNEYVLESDSIRNLMNFVFADAIGLCYNYFLLVILISVFMMVTSTSIYQTWLEHTMAMLSWAWTPLGYVECYNGYWPNECAAQQYH